MLKKYYPYEYADSVFDIDYNKLYALGFRSLIFDIDNTLVHHGDDSTEQIDRFFKVIQDIGFKTLLLTNNDEERVKRFTVNISTDYICEADKPSVDGYLKALDILGTSKAETVFIGDQVFTDILGANRCGIPSILVKFIRADNETKIGKKRYIEKIIMFLFRTNKSARNRLGDIYKEKVN